MNKLSMFVKSRSFKRGSLSAALTVIVIAAVIVLNIIVTALAQKYYWYIDMTKDNIFKLTDEALAVVGGIDDEINIIFCNDIDALQSNLFQKSVYNTALELTAAYDNIHIKTLDVYKNPSSVNKYKTTAATKINDQSVIIESGTEFRVFPLQSFFTFNENGDVWAYNGEYRIISTILQITASEHPKAYFTIGHGESLADPALWNLFADAGYDVQTVDLTKDDVSEFDDARFIVINDPVYDFQGISADTAGKKSEIEKIDDFLDGFGCLMVFVDPDTAELPVLYSFLKEWGVVFDGRLVKDCDSSLTTDGAAIVAQYSMGENTGASLISSITSMGLPPKAIVKNATPVRMAYSENGNRVISPVLMTTHNARIFGDDGLAADGGQYNLMTLTRETRYIDNQVQYSYVLAAGTTAFATEEYIGQKAYSNSDILYAAMKQMGKERVPVDLDLKPFDNDALDITATEATGWTVALVTIIPLIAIFICIIVLIRRRHA